MLEYLKSQIVGEDMGGGAHFFVPRMFLRL